MMARAQWRVANGVVVLSAVLALLPVSAAAQTAGTGSIAGVARDASGGVLPGVTVEAASPALIEKSRTVLTDGAGQYRITDLRPGTYSVTFSLEGFNTEKREGIELNTGFTATVNGELKVGTVAETITVSGASPIVDTQNVTTNATFTHDVLEALPTGAGSTKYAALIVGATSALGPDVGGSKGEMSNAMQIHGSRQTDYRMHVDGMTYNYAAGGGNSRAYYTNPASAQEVVLEYANASAETETGGISQNAVLKDGGNLFTAMGTLNYATPRLEANNFTPALAARGLTNVNSVKHIYDDTIALGGPIKKDSLWFYTAHRLQSAQEYYAGIYFNQANLQNTLFYKPDLSRPAFLDLGARDDSLRLTWQHGKQKYTFFESVQSNLQGYFEISGNTASLSPVAPEATGNLHFRPTSLTQGTWTLPASSKILLEAGFTYGHNTWDRAPIAGNTPNAISVLDQATNFRYGARATYEQHYQHQMNGRFSVSYVTGAHNAKFGFQYFGTPPGGEINESFANQDLNYTFSTPTTGGNPIPKSITEYATPTESLIRRRNIGLYAQDQWTFKRLTLNGGIRLDTLKEWAPAQSRAAGQFVPAASYPAIDNVPNWKDVDPRLGIAWDLFGDGKTAVKAALGRYVVLTSPVGSLAPVNAIVASVTRNWNDTNTFPAGDPRNGNYIPDCDLHNNAANGECGAVTNSAFGTPVINTTWAPDLVTGFETRNYSWQGTAALSHELRPGLGFTVAYFRTSYGNPTITDNVLVTPTDYSTFCVAAPTDPALGSVSGQQICGLYDLNPALNGKVQNVMRHASDFGTMTDIFQSVEVTANARFGRGGRIAGGWFKGNEVTDTCSVIYNSPQLQFCHQQNPNTQFKINGSYPLPWDLQASWVYQNLQGAPILATQVYTNDQIFPSLKRNLGSCGTQATCNGTVTVNLIAPNTLFEARYQQLDGRLTKTLHQANHRVQLQLDVYNVLNTSYFTGRNNAYGSQWGKPNGMQLGRLVKLGTQVNW